MDKECLSRGEALKFCADYQYLVGRPFERYLDFSVVVTAVLVVPYGAARPDILRLIHHPAGSVPLQDEDTYEVIVVGNRTDGIGSDLLIRPLKAYTEEHGLVLNRCNYDRYPSASAPSRDVPRFGPSK